MRSQAGLLPNVGKGPPNVVWLSQRGVRAHQRREKAFMRGAEVGEGDGAKRPEITNRQFVAARHADPSARYCELARQFSNALVSIVPAGNDVSALVLPKQSGSNWDFFPVIDVDVRPDFSCNRHLGNSHEQTTIGYIMNGGDQPIGDQSLNEFANSPLKRQVHGWRRSL